ncbi:iron-sulfur binding hydrogenase [Thermosipho atlanticus]|uniref:DRTGG domain-containing protein n=1 Tax=Thermosipho atlanticus DSM 15807 TaxID=1123380 RepID=A0A1M5TK53_9BACT|nr:iron-sulfur binding hydrogenase [Thermosipho atlanticus]SHH51058.1 hypothetical protein SAMN02745199_1358 [Thermosipho atlanticus DSM 15807]
MKLSKIIEQIPVKKVLWNSDYEISHAYTGDLLSMVMKNAKSDSIWITVQSHVNIVAVASMVGIRAIILCEGKDFSQETVEKAKDEGITLLKSNENAYTISGKLYELGLK